MNRNSWAKRYVHTAIRRVGNGLIWETGIELRAYIAIALRVAYADCWGDKRSKESNGDGAGEGRHGSVWGLYYGASVHNSLESTRYPDAFYTFQLPALPNMFSLDQGEKKAPKSRMKNLRETHVWNLQSIGHVDSHWFSWYSYRVNRLGNALPGVQIMHPMLQPAERDAFPLLLSITPQEVVSCEKQAKSKTKASQPGF